MKRLLLHKNIRKKWLSTLLLIFAGAGIMAQDSPHLEMINGTVRLVRNGKPMIMLSGELHNSTSSDTAALIPALRTAKAMGMNSVIATISWEQIEPEEGKFDFTELDNLLAAAGNADMPLGLIWFAGYKNGESSYAPLWVKRDTKRFPRCRFADGRNSTTLSPLYQETANADARAFARVMEHLKQTDTKHLVCIIQIENEMGAFMDIDHSSAAVKAFGEQVPERLIRYLKQNEKRLGECILRQWTAGGKRTKGNWTEVFGDGELAKQFFMAWNFGHYAEQVAAAGKEKYALPMYVNCWLAGENAQIGSYPNSGPRTITLDVYKAAAPHVDILAPDVYVKDFRNMFDAYTRHDNPLFIPEVSREAGPAYYAFGEKNAICYAPFGFEEIYDDSNFVGEYRTLGEILPEISEAQGTGRMHGFARQEGIDQPDDSTSFQLGDYIFRVHYVKGEAKAHGLAIKIADDEFLVAGLGSYIDFGTSRKGEVCKIAFAEEIERCNGEWKRIFVLNGDETAHHNMLYLRGRMPMPDYDKDGIQVPGPIYRPSYQRMHMSNWQNRYKVSGIYRIKLYSYPER